MKLPDSDLWKKLSPAFDALLDADASVRAERLAELRRDDPALHDKLVALLSSADLAEETRFLGHAIEPPPPEDLPGMTGRRIGAYVIDALLGQGGRCSVLRPPRVGRRYERPGPGPRSWRSSRIRTSPTSSMPA